MGGEIIIAGGGARGLFFADMLTNKLGRRVAAIADNYEPGHAAIHYRVNEFGTPDTRIFVSVDDALASVPRTQASILFVMTPEWAHLDVFRKAIDAGCHVFLEKPLATVEAGARASLIALAADESIRGKRVVPYRAC